jgi:hypothetical protein
LAGCPTEHKRGHQKELQQQKNNERKRKAAEKMEEKEAKQRKKKDMEENLRVTPLPEFQSFSDAEKKRLFELDPATYNDKTPEGCRQTWAAITKQYLLHKNRFTSEKEVNKRILAELKKFEQQPEDLVAWIRTRKAELLLTTPADSASRGNGERSLVSSLLEDDTDSQELEELAFLATRSLSNCTSAE